MRDEHSGSSNITCYYLPQTSSIIDLLSLALAVLKSIKKL